MLVTGIIPARYGSTRFPGKPLVEIQGKSMIQRVYEQAQKAPSLHEVYVATDDARIWEHVKQFGGKAIITSADHQSGTDRCREAVDFIPEKPDVVINIQGDEPFIDPAQIEAVVTIFEDTKADIATLIKPISHADTLHNPNRVKAVVNAGNFALYFSRQPIPYFKNLALTDWHLSHQYYMHMGIYGYRTTVLEKIAQLPPSALEKAESLEQLRWLENGYSIKTAVTTVESFGIDTPEDLENLKL